MKDTMMNTATTLMEESKKSFDTLLREKAYNDIAGKLSDEGIDIKALTDSDMEALVAEKVNDMKNGIKGFTVGGVFTLLLSSVVGF